MQHVHSAGGIIINPKNEICVVLNNTGSWQFPKGGVDEGESFVQTAEREIQEETGIRQLTYIADLPEYSRISRQNSDIERHIHYFLFTTDEVEVVALAEIEDVRWVAMDDVQELITYPEDKAFFESVREVIEKYIATEKTK